MPVTGDTSPPERTPPPERPLKKGPGHGRNGRFITTVDVAERDQQAARLWSQGLSYRQIGRIIGLSSPAGVKDAVERGLAASRRLDTEAIEAARHRIAETRRVAAELEAKAREIMAKKHLATNHRGVIWHNDEPLEDHTLVLGAIDRALAAQKLALAADEREAKLLGLDAAQKVNVSGGVTYEVVGVDPADLIGGSTGSA